MHQNQHMGSEDRQGFFRLGDVRKFGIGIYNGAGNTTLSNVDVLRPVVSNVMEVSPAPYQTGRQASPSTPRCPTLTLVATSR